MKIAIIASGGDSPGMNSCIAELVIRGCSEGHDMCYYPRGFCGIRDGEIHSIRPADVYGLHRRGGASIKSGRLPTLKEEDTQRHLAEILRQTAIDALVVMGGDGSFQGARALCRMAPDINFIGIPCTIDNNIHGSDYSLGFDTALNKLVQYIDDITDTASSMYPRVFFVETLGGPDSYFARLPVKMGISDFCIIPDMPVTAQEVAVKIDAILKRNDKEYVIVTVAESTRNITGIMEHVGRSLGVSVKYNLIGYQQRGGAPTAADRLHAANFASQALALIENDMKNQYVVFRNGQYAHLNLAMSGLKKDTSSADF